MNNNNYKPIDCIMIKKLIKKYTFRKNHLLAVRKEISFNDLEYNLLTSVINGYDYFIADLYGLLKKE